MRLATKRLGWLLMAIFCVYLSYLQQANAQQDAKSSLASRRLALVIGNDEYQQGGRLENAVNDATAMALELRAAGFDVTLALNLRYREMVRKIEFFASQIRGGDQIVVFFAGHGVQLRSGNYLLPIDIDASSESEAEKTSYPMNDLMDRLAEAKASFSLLLVDACRDNPMRTRGRSFGSALGLLPPEPPKGQMVVYAASKGQRALDKLSPKDDNPNGLFTRELISRMRKPGLRIEELAREVQDAVENAARAVGHEQRPAIYNESRGVFVFYEGSAPSSNPITGPNSGGAPSQSRTKEQIEDEFWDSVKSTNDPASLEFYLKTYPVGRYRELAQLALSKAKSMPLASPAIAAPSAPPGKLAAAVIAPGKSFKDCGECPEMVSLPSGNFLMGSNPAEQARAVSEGLRPELSNQEDPAHSVTLTSYALGKFEVTRGQFGLFVAATGYQPAAGCWVLSGGKWVNSPQRSWRNPGYAQTESDPVTCVNWDDAQAYVQWLSQKTGKTYHLPSEAQWEYACRAGQRLKYCGSDNGESVAIYDRRRGDRSQPGGSKQANAWGIYDMSGNQMEWTQDCWNGNYRGAPPDGSAWTRGDCAKRVLRGGSWLSPLSEVRAAGRISIDKVDRDFNNGFRVARMIP